MSTVADQLDTMHELVKEALKRGDFESYRDIFAGPEVSPGRRSDRRPRLLNP